VNRQTESLIEHIAPVEPANEGDENGEAPKPKKARTTRAKTAGTKASAKTTRSRKADTAPGKPLLRPSKRGFKWPSPQQAEQAESSGEE
jgi:hypothetical protein